MDGRLHVKMRNEEADDERGAKTDETSQKQKRTTKLRKHMRKKPTYGLSEDVQSHGLRSVILHQLYSLQVHRTGFLHHDLPPVNLTGMGVGSEV